MKHVDVKENLHRKAEQESGFSRARDIQEASVRDVDGQCNRRVSRQRIP